MTKIATRLLLPALVLMTILAGCRKSALSPSDDRTKAAVRFSLSAVNVDNESRVADIRVVIADPESGQILYTGDPWASPDNYTQVSEAVELEREGLFDVYFFGNFGPENAAFTSPEVRSLLSGMQNTGRLFPQKRIPFEGKFDPATHLFPMTAVYRDVEITAESATTPVIIPAKLVRSFAKVEVILRRTQSTSGAEHAVIDRLYLANQADSFTPLFAVSPGKDSGIQNSTAATEVLSTSELTAIDYELATVPGEGVIEEAVCYIPELLRMKEPASENSPTELVIRYRQTASSTQVKELRIPIDSQNAGSGEELLRNLGLDAQDWDNIYNFDRISVVRNVHYKITIRIDDAILTATPEIEVEVLPWEIDYLYYSAEDLHFTASKETVTLNFNEGDHTDLMLLSDITDHRSVSYALTPADASSWLSVSDPQTLDGNQTITITARTENAGSVPRSAAVTFTPDGYEHPVSIQVRQLPRQDLAVRKYVAFVGTGGSAEIEINNYGYGWEAGIVESGSTVSSPTPWLTLSKTGDKLTLTAETTSDIDLIRHAVVKVWDGSGRSAYIWVEQGNYKEVTVGGTTLLDRNLGALSTPTKHTAWTADYPISKQERVRLGGYFYQWGRIPDGYQMQGMDNHFGTINYTLTSLEKNSSPTDAFVRPGLSPLKWDDLARGTVQDPQYGRFITAEPWLTNAVPFPSLWTNPKAAGIDPCPEGYRLPSVSEMQSILSGAVYHEGTYGYWQPNAGASGGEVIFPYTSYRYSSGELADWPGTGGRQETLFYTYESNGDGTAKAVTLTGEVRSVSVSCGAGVRCVKE